MSVHQQRERCNVTALGASSRVLVRVANNLACQDSRLDRIDDVLLVVVRLRSAVRHVREAVAQRAGLIALGRVETLFELSEDADHVVMKRRTAQNVEHAAHCQ
jgi:hypothetical protein